MTILKNFANLLLTLGAMTGLSYGSYRFCNWYECDGWSAFLRSDLICNACVDVSYHLKNHQLTLYAGVFTLFTSKLSSFISKASSSSSDNYIFEEYELGKKSPRSLKLKKLNKE
jgi:hypothetical protein